MTRLKKVLAAAVACLFVFSAATEAQAFRNAGRDSTYVYDNIWFDVPIPDAFQYRSSIYLREMVGEVPVFNRMRSEYEIRQVTRPVEMFIAPETSNVNPNWVFVVENELNSVIVLDDNHQLFMVSQQYFNEEGELARTPAWRSVPGSTPPPNARPMITSFVISKETFNATFDGMVPQEDMRWPDQGRYILDATQIRNRKNEFMGWQCSDNCEHDNPYGLACPGLPDDALFTTRLRSPEGIFVCRNGIMYVADTQNNRVLVVTPRCDFLDCRNRNVDCCEGRCGEDCRSLVCPSVVLEITLVIYMPTQRELGGETLASFLPAAVVADTAGRISVVARTINNGILQFSRQGEFNRFIGAPSVVMDPWTRMWRRFQTAEQRAGAPSFVPTEYHNIRIDERNFIWGAIAALRAEDIRGAVADPEATVAAVKKLNPLGQDILKRKGERGVWGDVPGWEEPSRIIDVAIGPAGIYTLLDSRRGRLFTFNDDGIMLFAFGNLGNRKGNFQQPVAIGYIGDNIAVLDSRLWEIIIFEPTLYGELVIAAETHFMAGNYELAYDAWADAANQNANFRHAFYGLGNARFNERDFVQSTLYFIRSGGEPGREGYSRARDMMRRDQMEVLFPIISSVIIGGVILLVGFMIFKGVRNYALGDDMIGFRPNSDDE